MPLAGHSAPAFYIVGVALAYAWFFLQWPFWSLSLVVLAAGVLLLVRAWRITSDPEAKTGSKNKAVRNSIRSLAPFPALKFLLLLTGLLLTSLALQWQLQDRYTRAEDRDPITVQGRISGLPENFGDYTRFRFHPFADPNSSTQDLPSELLVSWYRNAPELRPGQTWQLEMQIKPPWALVNFQGMDKERWLFAEGLGGLATVRQGRLIQQTSWRGQLDRLRQQLSGDIAVADSQSESLGMIRALAVGDRSGMNREQRDALANTGTSHLLAISGLHVGLAYLFAFGLARLLLLPIGHRLQNSQLYCLMFGWLVACTYAGLAGFSTATVRALVMLSVVLCLLLIKRNIRPLYSMWLALAVVLIIEPLAPLQAGAWMSFVAVAALLFWFVPRRGHNNSVLARSLQAQLAIMCFCLPFSAWWFQSSSPAGLLANLVAIPWVSFAVVPLVLMALALWPIYEPAFYGLVKWAAYSTDGLMLLLQNLGNAVDNYSTLLQPGWFSLVMAVLAGGLLLLPRSLRLQLPAVLLMLPLLLPAQATNAGKLQLEVLDVGQGTSLLLQIGSKLLLYDSGPGDGNGNDLVNSVIHPAVLASGFGQPDRIIISHADLDHAGGLAGLQRRYPEVAVYGSFPQPRAGIQACDDRLGWSWQGSHFAVLHPSAYLPYQGNDSSCVLDIDVGQFKLLFTGDISTKVERRLLSRKLDVYRILLVPHHGSRSSSDPELLRATSPELAIATAGTGNRFGFPRPEVQQRYADAGIRLLSTDQCGAIRLEIAAGGQLQLHSARRQRKAPWRWPAGGDCP